MERERKFKNNKKKKTGIIKMNQDWVNKAQLIIKQIYRENKEQANKFGKGVEERHSQDTLNWIIKIDKNASSSLQIAGLFHDIDRTMTDYKGSFGIANLQEYRKYKKEHAARCAKLTRQLLQKNNFPSELIKQVANLISNHDNYEISNDSELEILRLADSLAFFNNNDIVNLQKYGSEKHRLKVKFMVERIKLEQKHWFSNLKVKDELTQRFLQEALKI